MIVLLQEKMGLNESIGQLQNHLKHLESLYDKLTHKFNYGEIYIRQLLGTTVPYQKYSYPTK